MRLTADMTPSLTSLPPESVLVVLGTRPEIIKLGHVIRLLGDRAAIVHTGQHFDTGLSETFFEAFALPRPAALLGVGGDTRGAQIGRAVTGLDTYIRDHDVRVVVVQGDTNSAFAGAIAANATQTPLVHVEAGLRSFDRRMPEEHNRVLVDHLADSCAAPTETNRANLRAEAIPDERINVTGNTVVEAVQSLLPDLARRQSLLEAYGLDADGFILSTFHRPENVDDPDTLRVILQQLATLPIPVVLPVHPRTADRIAATPGLAAAVGRIRLIDPLGYEEFIGLAAESALLISDSGGIQEEASVLKRPVIVVRRSTERPEVLGTFATLLDPRADLVGAAQGWLDDLPALHARLEGIPSPYGDGSASRTIVDLVAALAGS
jgi:UDP-N-acetylglucosamine 2-epimerase (non-hydrolysing)